MGLEAGLNLNDMLGGLTELLDDDTLKRITGTNAPKTDDNVTISNIMIMLNGILSDENNKSAINGLIAKIKPLLNDDEKKVLENDKPSEGLKNLIEKMSKNPDRIKKLAGILFD